MIRTKWMDPDFRREPKTDRYCEICHRDLKIGQPHREVRRDLRTYEAIHPEDWAAADAAGLPVKDGEIGMDCARRLGLEWSAPA